MRFCAALSRFEGRCSTWRKLFPTMANCDAVFGACCMGLASFTAHANQLGSTRSCSYPRSRHVGCLGRQSCAPVVECGGFRLWPGRPGRCVAVAKRTGSFAMDLQMVVETFVVVVMGGLGSIAGAFYAAILIGCVHAFGIHFFRRRRWSWFFSPWRWCWLCGLKA